MQIRVIMDNDAAIKALANFGLKKAPKIVAKTLNQTAEAVTNQLQRNIKRQFILRSKFTLRSTVSPCARPYKALNKASGRSIARMFSRAGSASPYLWKQEDGGIFAAKKGGAYPVATTKSRVSGSLRRAVRKAYRLPLQSLTDGEYGEIGDAFIGVPKGATTTFLIQPAAGRAAVSPTTEVHASKNNASSSGGQTMVSICKPSFLPVSDTNFIIVVLAVVISALI